MNVTLTVETYLGVPRAKARGSGATAPEDGAPEPPPARRQSRQGLGRLRPYGSRSLTRAAMTPRRKLRATTLIAFARTVGRAVSASSAIDEARHDTQLATAPVPPALLAATFDTLANFPVGQRVEPALLIAISRRIGGSDAQSVALLARIRAAAIVLRDPRWLPWTAYIRTCGRDTYCLFDAAILQIVASLPLPPALRFDADHVFDDVLARALANGHG